MKEYTIGFIVGIVTMYLALRPQLKQFDQILKDIHSKLNEMKVKNEIISASTESTRAYGQKK